MNQHKKRATFNAMVLTSLVVSMPLLHINFNKKIIYIYNVEVFNGYSTKIQVSQKGRDVIFRHHYTIKTKLLPETICDSYRDLIIQIGQIDGKIDTDSGR